MSASNEEINSEPEQSIAPDDKGKQSVFPDIDGINHFFLVIVMIALGLVALQTGIVNRSSACVTLLWAIACMSVGATVGFLFGLTKVDQAVNNSQARADADKTDIDYKPLINTNLIEISDWLTKIIVGLGLINLKEIPGQLKRIAIILAGSSGNDGGLSLAIAIIVGFTVIGFLVGYLNTRTVIALMLDAADRRLLRKVKLLESRLEKSKSKQEASDVVNESRLQAVSSVIVPPEEQKTPNNLRPLDSELKRMAEAYENVNALDRTERVKLKGKTVSEMLRYILSTKIPKKTVAMWAEETPRDGLIIALAAYVIAVPQKGDLELLLKVAPKAKWLHVKFRVSVAFRELFKNSFGDTPGWDQVSEVLEKYHERAVNVHDRSLIAITEEVMSLIRSNSQ